MKAPYVFDSPERCCCGEGGLRFRCRSCGKINPAYPYRSDLFRWAKQFTAGVLISLVIWACTR